MYRRGSGHGGARREIRGGRGVRGAAGDPIDAVLLALGSDITNWWEPRPDPITTVVSTLASRIHDVRETDFGTPTLEYQDQATAGSRPSWNAIGTALSQPSVDAQDAARYMEATTTIATGNRTAIYCVGAMVANLFLTNGASAGDNQTALLNGVAGFRFKLRDSAGNSNAVSATTPVIDTAAHLFSMLPLAAGWSYQVDGTQITVNPTESDTVEDMIAARVFHQGGTSSGGEFFARIHIANITAAKDAIVKQYIAARFPGLTIS